MNDKYILKMQRWFLTDHPELNRQQNREQNYEIKMTEKVSVMSETQCETVLETKTFSVAVSDLGPREAVYITGNLRELGEWKYDQMIPLTPLGDIWSTTVKVPASTDVLYRYCVAVVDRDPQQIAVRRWESNPVPRKLFGHLKATDQNVFGQYSGNDGVSKGWLITDTLVQFKFLNNSLRLKSRISSHPLRLKVTPLTLSLSPDGICGTSEEASVSTDTGEGGEVSRVHVEVSNVGSEECVPHAQPQFGSFLSARDILVVSVRAPGANNLAYLLDVYAATVRGVDDEVPTHVASTYVLPDTLQKSEARLDLPLTCHVKQRPIGMVRVECLVVYPMPGPLYCPMMRNHTREKKEDITACPCEVCESLDEWPVCDMNVSYAKYWDPSWTGLEVGHRGLGASFKTKEGNEIRENTIASLKRAAASGADLLEFDVQLSRDMVPVIYHDFHVCISMRRKKQVDYTDMLELPVKDLSLDQLQKLKVYHLVEGRSNEPRFFDEELEEHQPFPTLHQALNAVDSHVGFNVELKWNMEREDGTFELNNPFDMNAYVDKVLQVILKHAELRRIVFSSFNPDICTMVRNKQNKYPVMFLTQGQTERYPRYRDDRCVSIAAAVRHARASDILGVVVHTEDLLRDPTQVNLTKEAGLVLFCWGDDNNDRETIRRLKEMGLHAVIYDKLDQLTTKQVKESIFLVEARDSQKELLRVAGEGAETGAAGAPGATPGAVEVRRVEAALRQASMSASVATACSLHFDRKRAGDKELQHKASATSFLGVLPAAPAPAPAAPAPPKRTRSDM